MSERAENDWIGAVGSLRCPTCQTPYQAGDHFCAQCGTDLTAPSSPAAPAGDPAIAADAPSKQEQPIWLFAAPPRAVIGGGVLLLLLAAALLAIGQLDHTGTIVMASICLAPLALLTVAIGIVRGVTR